MAAKPRRNPYVLALVGVVVLAVLAYSLLVVQQILLGIAVALWALVLYVAWRFVRALERIAAALEARADAQSEPGGE